MNRIFLESTPLAIKETERLHAMAQKQGFLDWWDWHWYEVRKNENPIKTHKSFQAI